MREREERIIQRESRVQLEGVVIKRIFMRNTRIFYRMREKVMRKII
jgi:hypothetical protein